MSQPRHLSRQQVIQALYQLEMFSSQDFHLLDDFWVHLDLQVDDLEYVQGLLIGCIKNAESIDSILDDHMQSWRLERLSILSRSILRLAVFEMLYDPQTPYPVVVNESLELGRAFVGESICGFINSVLQKVNDSHGL